MKLCRVVCVVAGGRYQIYTEKRRGFVDTSLIIAGVNMGDHGTR